MQPRNNPNTTTQQQQQLIRNAISKKYSQSKQYLYLNKCEVWRQVLQYQDWTQLRQLHLGRCNIDDSDVELVAKMHWPNLQRLYIDDNKITAAGFKQLLKKELPKLEQLRINHNNIGDEGMQMLTITQHLLHLKQLDVDKNSISWMGMICMPNCPFTQFQKLSLNYNKIGRIGIKLLVKADIKLLQYLQLCECQIGDEGVRQLAKGHWPKLFQLNLGDNKIILDGWLSVTNIKFKYRLRIDTSSYQQQNQPIAILNLLGRSLLSYIGSISSDNLKVDLQQILENLNSEQ